MAVMAKMIPFLVAFSLLNGSKVESDVAINNDLLSEIRGMKEDMKGVKDTLQMTRMAIMSISQLAKNMEDRINEQGSTIMKISHDMEDRINEHSSTIMAIMKITNDVMKVKEDVMNESTKTTRKIEDLKLSVVANSGEIKQNMKKADQDIKSATIANKELILNVSTLQETLIAADQELKHAVEEVNQDLVKNISKVNQDQNQKITKVNHDLEQKISKINQDFKKNIRRVDQSVEKVKQNVSEGNQELRQEIVKIDENIEKSVTKFDQELKQNVAKVKKDMKDNMAKVCHDINKNEKTITSLNDQLVKELQSRSLLDRLFPVGSVHMTFINSQPPMNSKNGVSWELLPEGYTLMTANGKNTGTRLGAQRLDSGGTNGHVLTAAEMPRHSHQYVKNGAYSVGKSSSHHKATASRIIENAGKTSETGSNKAHSHKLDVLNQKVMVWRRKS